MSSKDIAATTPNKRLHEDKAVNWSKPENVEKLRHYWDLTHGSIEDTARAMQMTTEALSQQLWRVDDAYKKPQTNTITADDIREVINSSLRKWSKAADLVENLAKTYSSQQSLGKRPRYTIGGSTKEEEDSSPTGRTNLPKSNLPAANLDLAVFITDLKTIVADLEYKVAAHLEGSRKNQDADLGSKYAELALKLRRLEMQNAQAQMRWKGQYSKLEEKLVHEKRRVAAVKDALAKDDLAKAKALLVARL